jgi:hypothetical protein
MIEAKPENEVGIQQNPLSRWWVDGYRMVSAEED